LLRKTNHLVVESSLCKDACFLALWPAKYLTGHGCLQALAIGQDAGLSFSPRAPELSLPPFHPFLGPFTPSKAPTTLHAQTRSLRGHSLMLFALPMEDDASFLFLDAILHGIRWAIPIFL